MVRARLQSLAIAGSIASLLSHATSQSLVDPNLSVATIVDGLEQPIAMAFLGAGDLFVTEKASGRVKRVQDGVVTGVVLDLAVNSASERGLLGIALHPDFPATPWVYLFHTESTTGQDSTQLAETPLLGNLVSRFTWNGSTLALDATLLRLRAFQNDRNAVTNPLSPFENPDPLLRGNHNGGVLRFGPFNRLFVISGDAGRRGWTQNNFIGPIPDDEFGGPLPDDAHTTGVIRRIADDGTIPPDNPFYALGAAIGVLLGGPLGIEVAEAIQRVYAIGVRNSFGMAIDPICGKLWTTENGGRAFDEINYVEAGFNGGWVQLMGPLGRVADYRSIEVAAGIGPSGPQGLQQLRWPATNIAATPGEAATRVLQLPNMYYDDPRFSWKHVVPPAGLGFVNSDALGAQYFGDLIVGSAVFRPTAAPPSVMANPGHLYRFRLNGARDGFVFSDPALQDLVADNLGRDDWVTEGGEILFGTDFGIVTDVHTGPDGALYLVGTSSGTIRKIWRP